MQCCFRGLEWLQKWDNKSASLYVAAMIFLSAGGMSLFAESRQTCFSLLPKAGNNFILPELAAKLPDAKASACVEGRGVKIPINLIAFPVSVMLQIRAITRLYRGEIKNFMFVTSMVLVSQWVVGRLSEMYN